MTPDGITWTFNLRKGVKFHDGVEVTAKDVKFSIEQTMLPDSSSVNASFIRRDVKSIEVKDPYTVVIHCKKPAIFLPDLLGNMEGLDGMIVPKDYYEKVGKDGFIKRPIGSGPYKWAFPDVGSFIKLEATDKHWRDGVPRFKYMTYLSIPRRAPALPCLRRARGYRPYQPGNGEGRSERGPEHRDQGKCGRRRSDAQYAMDLSCFF